MGVAGLRATDGLSAQSSSASGARGRPVDQMQLGSAEMEGAVGHAEPASDAPGSPYVSPTLVQPAAAATYSATSQRASAGGFRAGGWRHSYRLGLLVVLTVQAGLALRLVWSNTAFADEAEYLWYGHLEWQHWLYHGGPLPQGFLLSGAAQIYPPLGALADSLGGLVGARLLSLGFMLGATALLYATASRLFSRRAGLFGAAMFAAVGPTADLGAWATYDPMAVCLMALASWLAVRAARS